MADLFQQIEWTDKQVQFPARRQLTNVSTQEKKTVVVERAEGNVYQEGNLFGAAALNDLEERLARAFNEIDELLNARINLYYPVGKVFMAFTDFKLEQPTHLIVNDKELFPGTTWQKLSGYALMVSTGDAGQTGGSKSVAIKPVSKDSQNVDNRFNVNSASVQAHSLTVSEMPVHNHSRILATADFKSASGSTGGFADGSAWGYDVIDPNTSYAGSQGGSHSHGFSITARNFTGATLNQTLQQIYIPIFVWRRLT